MAKKTELRKAIRDSENSGQSEAHLIQGFIEDLLADDSPMELIEGSLEEMQDWLTRFLSAVKSDIKAGKPCDHSTGTRGGICEQCGKEI